jgi:hypothetical protein
MFTTAVVIGINAKGYTKGYTKGHMERWQEFPGATPV